MLKRGSCGKYARCGKGMLEENSHTPAKVCLQTTAELVKKDLPRFARQAQM